MTGETIHPSDDPFWSEANQERLRRSIAQQRAGRMTERALIDVDDDDPEDRQGLAVGHSKQRPGSPTDDA